MGRDQNVKLIYTDHARDQMRDRAISEAEVKVCWNDHHTTYADKKGNSVYIADVNGRRIKVVVDKQNSRVVITAAD
jgi:hypothetical protein